MATITSANVEQLFGSDADHPALILIEGRVDVVDADALRGPDYRGAMLVATRDDLAARADTEPDRHTLDELAAQLDANLTNLGAWAPAHLR
jgi:hypothetical protein